MLEEIAQVVRVAEDGVWVETRRQSTCNSCAAEKGCGTATLSKVLGKRRTLVRVVADMRLQVGDRVVIGIREQALVRGSLAVYAVPLLLMLVGAVVGELGASRQIWNDAELASMLLGIAGLVAGLYWLKIFTGRIKDDQNYQPVVLRRLNGSPAGKIAVL